MIILNGTPRTPILLEEYPFGLRLMLHKFYPHYHPMNAEAIEWLLAHFIEASTTGHWNELVTGSISVTFPDGVRRASIRTTNSQFTALDRSNRLEFANGYEPATGALLDKLVPEDGVFCDIGANWGYFTLYLATRPSFHGTIHAFEPIPDSFGDLNGLIAELGLKGIAHAHNVALSDAAGKATMTVPNHFSGMAKLGASDGGLSVTLTTLDKLGLERVDFLKIDAESHEREVIEGGREIIAAHRPYILFEDSFDAAAFVAAGPRHISALLGELGYSLFLALWLRPDGKLYPVLADDPATQKLALFPLDYAQGRSVLPGHTNLLACHNSRLAEMAALLTAP